MYLRYAQDLAWHHSAERGFTREWYAQRGLTWLARAATVGVERPVLVGDGLIGTTRVVGWRRVWARRRTEFVDPSGSLVAWTHVDWVLIDARGVPTRVPSDFEEVFGPLPATFPLGRVSLPPAPAETRSTEFVVRPQELDPMGHANNAVYADWLDELVIGAGGLADVRHLPRRVDLEYARAAERDALLTGTAWRETDAGWSVRVADAAGTDLLRARLSAASSGSRSAGEG